MKKIIFALALAFCLVGCEQSGDITARYRFLVPDTRHRFFASDTGTKAVITNHDPLLFECEAGDEIAIKVVVYDADAFNKYSGAYPDDMDRDEYQCSLIYDGSAWNLEKDGRSSLELEVSGEEGSVVCLWYSLSNYPEGDTANWFNAGSYKRITLAPGNQTIVLDFMEATSIVQ